MKLLYDVSVVWFLAYFVCSLNCFIGHIEEVIKQVTTEIMDYIRLS